MVDAGNSAWRSIVRAIFTHCLCVNEHSSSSESRDWFTQEINFCADGTVMMEAQDLVDFTARASFMRTNHTMRQLPGRCISEYNFYRQAFTVGGLPLSPWTLAPDGATWVETPLSTGEVQRLISP